MDPIMLTYSCHPSSVRSICDYLIQNLNEEAINLLKELNIYQFFKMPGYRQENSLILQILNCWDIAKRSFNIGGKYLSFTSDTVALIIGMPNQGEAVKWEKSPLSDVNCIQIMDEIMKVDSGDSATSVVKLYIKFLFSNLFFSSSNCTVPSDLYRYAEDVHRFSSFNWPSAICDFLIQQIDGVTQKIKQKLPLRNMSGFVVLLMIWFYEHTSILPPTSPDARPRMMRWSKIRTWSTKSCAILFSNLRPEQILDSFKDLMDEELQLLAPTTHDISSPASILPTIQATSSPQYSSPTYFSEQIIPAHTSSPSNFEAHLSIEQIIHFMKIHEKKFLEFEASIHNKISELDKRLKIVEERQKKKPIYKSLLSSIVHGVKARQVRKRRHLGSPYTMYDGKRMRKNETIDVKHVEEITKGVETKPVDKEKVVGDIVIKEDETNNVAAAKCFVENATVEYVNTPLKHVSKEAFTEKIAEDIGQDKTSVIDVEQFVEKVVDFPGRENIATHMLEMIDQCWRRFNDKDDVIVKLGRVVITRASIDEILTNQYLANEHIDAFALLLKDKKKKFPHLYQPYLYISCLHWVYSSFKKESKMIVQHITRENVQKSKLLLVPIIHNEHWTLLVGELKSKKWHLYDSLPRKTHKDIAHEVVKLIVQDVGDAFESNPSGWPIIACRGPPTQTNSIDCGMFVCKYMEAVVSSKPIKWAEHSNWQQKMTEFRAEFAYELCLRSLSIQR